MGPTRPSPTRRPPQGSARQRIAARRRARRRRSCGGPLLALAAIAMLVLLLLGVGWRWFSTAVAGIEQADPRYSATDSVGPAVAPARSTALASPAGLLSQPFNVLLIGVDKRGTGDEGVRSDTLIIVHVEPVARWAALLSIPRDSVVAIPHLGEQKINAAYSFGYNNAVALYGAKTAPEAAGGALAAEAVAGFLGLPIDYIAQIDFQGFERVIDTLGGVLVDVERPLLDATYPTEDFGYERIYVAAGLQVLDGSTALRYARSRHSSSDFDRSHRQQQVLRAILSTARRRGLFEQAALLPQLAQDLGQMVTTTLPLSDLKTLQDLAALARDLDLERIEQFSINPAEVEVSEVGSDLYWDSAGVQEVVARFLAGPQP